MLILTRKIDQSVMIGLGYIKILGIERDRVKIGFEFPDNVTVVREEVLEQLYDKAVKPTPLRRNSKPLTFGSGETYE